jgi:hypothetical protein
MSGESTVRIALLLPDVLGTYSDRGNATVLAQRLSWRGIPAEVLKVTAGSTPPTDCEVFLLGGGEDAAQAFAAEWLNQHRSLGTAMLTRQVLAVCAGLQLLGSWMQTADGDRIAGAGILDLTTCAGHRAGSRAADRLREPSRPHHPGPGHRTAGPCRRRGRQRRRHRRRAHRQRHRHLPARARAGPQPRPRRPAAAPRHRPHPVPAAGPRGGRSPAAAPAPSASPPPSARTTPRTTGRAAQPSGVLPRSQAAMSWGVMSPSGVTRDVARLRARSAAIISRRRSHPRRRGRARQPRWTGRCAGCSTARVTRPLLRRG